MSESRISRRQFLRMMYVEGFGASGLTFPAVAAMESQSEGLFPVLIYGVFLVLFIGWLLYIIRKLEKRNPQGMYAGYGFVLNRWVGILYMVRMFLNGLALFYFFGISIQKIYMPDAGMFRILFPFAVLLWYCTQTTLQKRARFIELIFPWIVSLFVILIFFSILGVEGNFHLPALTEEASVLWNNGYVLLLCTAPLEFLLFLVPAVTNDLWAEEPLEKEKIEENILTLQWWKKRRNLVWRAAIGIWIGNAVLWFVTIENIGGELTASSPWPVIKVMQLIRLPGGFLERFDILLAVFWILCLVGVLSGYLYYGRKIGEELFGGKVSNGKTLRIRMSIMTGIVIGIMLLLCCVWSQEHGRQWLENFIFYKKWIDFPLLILLPLSACCLRPFRKQMAVAALVIGLLCLSGCGNQADVEEKSYVLSLYVEEGEDGYEYWVSKADLASIQEREDNIPCVTIHFTAENLEEMEEKYAKTEVGTLEWNHIDTIFLGPKLIENAEKTEQFLREWEASWQKSPDVFLSVCLQTAEELLEIKNIPKGAAGQEVNRLMEQAEKKEGKMFGRKQKESEGIYCRTPVEVLKAKAEGEKNIFLYQTKVQWKRLVLKKGYRMPEVLSTTRAT